MPPWSGTADGRVIGWDLCLGAAARKNVGFQDLSTGGCKLHSPSLYGVNISCFVNEFTHYTIDDILGYFQVMRLHKFNPCCHVFIPISCCTGTCVCLECIPRSAIYGVHVSLPVLFNNSCFPNQQH